MDEKFNDTNVGIDRYRGEVGDYLVSQSFFSVDSVSSLPIVLIKESIKHLYYGNYISGSEGFTSEVATASFNNDGTITGTISGSATYQPMYDNFEETTLNPIKIYTTSSIGVITIPSKLFGDNIHPGSFKIESPVSGTIYDDGEGRVYITGSLSGSDESKFYIGNISYSHGLITLTNLPNQNIII